MSAGGAVLLNDGRSMPMLGLGTWRLSNDAAASGVAAALRLGYRLVDTAAAYANEEGVGRGIRESGLPRADIFVTTKLWNAHHGYDNALRAFDASLARLGLDYVDLYLIHWPLPRSGKMVETYKALIHLRGEGRARSIGLSNFLPRHLSELVDATGVTPSVNQIELHPAFQQPESLALHESMGVHTQAWSPLGRQAGLADAGVASLARRLGLSPAQLMLAWHAARGRSAIPKTSRVERMAENLAAPRLALPADALDALDALDRGIDGRQGGDPETFEG